MTTSQYIHRQPAIWRLVRGAASGLRALHREQTAMWEVWWQAGRATVPSDGPLTWVLALDGHRLAGSYLPNRPGTATEDPL